MCPQSHLCGRSSDSLRLDWMCSPSSMLWSVLWGPAHRMCPDYLHRETPWLEVGHQHTLVSVKEQWFYSIIVCISENSHSGPQDKGVVP